MSLRSLLRLWLSADYCSPCMWVTDTLPSCAAQSAVPFAMPANICSTKTISSFQHSNGGYTICQQATQLLPGELGPGCIRRGINSGGELIFLPPFPPSFIHSLLILLYFLLTFIAWAVVVLLQRFHFVSTLSRTVVCAAPHSGHPCVPACICSRCFGSVTLSILMQNLNKFSYKVYYEVW